MKRKRLPVSVDPADHKRLRGFADTNDLRTRDVYGFALHSLAVKLEHANNERIAAKVRKWYSE
jgi:hypothetical protein